MSIKKGDILDSLRTIVPTLLIAHPLVYVSLGCGKMYVSYIKPKKCVTCKGVHPIFKITNISDIEDIVL